MDFRRDESTRTVRTPAKLNLYLEVFGRRSDNYHELETLMVPVALWDSLSLTPIPSPGNGEAARIDFDVYAVPAAASPSQQVSLPAGRDNLVVRALELLRERSGCLAGAYVRLVKRIPVAAGLGGGSSDAAAALRLGNRVWRLGYTNRQLAALGAELGSDVPFFIYGRPAVCRGRGEIVQPLAGSRQLHAVIAHPTFGLSTPQVYAAHATLAAGDTTQSAPSLGRAIDALRGGDWPALGRSLTNRLEAAAAALTPWVGQVRSVFERLRCTGHQLSGSGAAYFGICRHAADARRHVAMLRGRQLGAVYAVSSCL